MIKYMQISNINIFFVFKDECSIDIYTPMYNIISDIYIHITVIVSQLQSSLNTNKDGICWCVEELFGIRLGAALNQTPGVHAKLNGALHAVASWVVLVSEEGRHST